MLLRIDAVGAVRHRHDVAHRAVVLVPDFANQLLQNVFVSDDSQGPAVIVRDHRDIDLFARHNLQKIIDLGRLMNEIRLIEQRTDIQRLAPADIVADIAADVQDSDDMVDRSLIDRQAAVILLLDKCQNLFLRHIDIDRRHIDPACQDTLYCDSAKLQGG